MLSFTGFLWILFKICSVTIFPAAIWLHIYLNHGSGKGRKRAVLILIGGPIVWSGAIIAIILKFLGDILSILNQYIFEPLGEWAEKEE